METVWTKSQVGRKGDGLGNVMVHVYLGVMEVFLSNSVYNAALN
jgi:hypothetical protein